MSQIKYPFNPQLGTEEAVLKQNPSKGAVYFTTDTRKIYLDFDEMKAKIPMGGNIGLFYGKMELSSPPIDGQTEFSFNAIDDIVGNDVEESKILIPNVNDLILNSDGCFYKVISVNEDVLNTEKLTIAGTNNGGNVDGPSGPESLAKAKFSRLKFASGTSVLYGEECWVEFATYATDDLGDPIIGNVGSFQLYIDGEPIDLKGNNRVVSTAVSTIDVNIDNVPTNELNRINIGPYLPIKDDSVEIKISATCNGITFTRGGNIYVTDLTLTWDYDETTINLYDSDDSYALLKWKITGRDIEKITYITIDDKIQLEPIYDSKINQEYKLYFKEFNLSHGAHKIEMYTTAIIGGVETSKREAIRKNMIVAKSDDPSTIISCGLFDTTLIQYNTVSIPVMIYQKENSGATAIVHLFEQGVEVDTWNNVPNCNADREDVVRHWVYTPTQAGDIQLKIICNNTTYTKTIFVEPLELDVKEVSGYAFRLKANEISSNTALKNWKWNNQSLNFSSNFDWNNGGLKNEKDKDGNIRQYITIKAGTSMTIPYGLFKSDLTRNTGKTFKIIFKATNCRDYDGCILHCKVDKYIATANVNEEIYLNIPQGQKIEYSDVMNASESSVNLIQPNQAEFNLTSKESRALFNEKYIKFNDKYYQCIIKVIDDTVEENDKQYYAFFYEMFSEKSYDGIVMNAQSATFKSTTQTLSTQYCEDRYVEFEIDISKANGDFSYITIWIDGIPAGYSVYGSDAFYDASGTGITVGSNDCDVQLYMLKIYEQGLEDKNHLDNFIADAPTVTEMLNRYKRNQVFDSRGIISPGLVAKANPDCLVHVYTLPTGGMTTTKKDKRYGCDYKQYHGSDKVALSAKNVMIKVQGTSSEKYVVAAANLDSDFYNFDKEEYIPTGFIDANNNNKQLKEEGWSMDGGSAIGSNFFCTKVNVASCENANNALNQEWYNMFQPYKSLLRCKNSHARDTMQFTNGVLFMEDHNPTFKTTGVFDAKKNNLFGEIDNYLSSPYPRFYSIGQMGNSKNNTHIFHDTSNPLECCIEVNDNQEPQQWMISDDYKDTDIDDNNEYYGFRYPEREEASETMLNGWRRLVSWMAHSDPSARYVEHIAKTEKEYKEFAVDKKTGDPIPTFILNSDKTKYESISSFDPQYDTYYTETEHINGYTNLPLSDEIVKRDYGDYTFNGYIADPEIQKKYTPLIKGCKVTEYNYQNFINHPTRQIANENGFTHDTYEYRMAKMLHECEQYLVMDSIIYHYLFIERHCMIDNVAKNTFWSTEDCEHWNLIKDYDNDTADGNDNQGKFTRTYGMEPMDKLNQNVYVFNAHQSVWLNFIAGLHSACEHMYRALENQTVIINNKAVNVWDKDAYLDLFEEWQKRIPEACWIEDYYRKYRRPYELYKTTMFNSMMEGGKKTHQRAQFETYQDTYISSKYFGTTCEESVAVIRGNGANMANYKLPFTLYSDCYVRSEMGSATSVKRAARGETYYLDSAAANVNNATIYFYPAKAFSTIGTTTGGRIGGYAPEQIDLSNAIKLREIVVSVKDDELVNTSLKDSFDVKNNNILEKLYVANLTSYKDKLDLSGCPNLRTVDASNSTFTEISIANNAPVETLLLENPAALILSNLYNLKTFDISNYNRLETLNINNIDKSTAKNLKNEFINSQTLVEKSMDVQLSSYKLTDVKWKLTKASDIKNSKINILETLFTKQPLMTDKGLEERKNCLTGILNISTNAFNGNSQEALAIYSNYACGDDPKYPNLDLQFETKNTTLYNVNIYDGDDNLIWSRKVTPNTVIDEDLFIDGPDGDFNAEQKLTKTSTAEYSFSFLKTWNITMGETKVTEFNSSTFEHCNPIYDTPITSDIHFRPNFEKKKRSYLVSIILNDPTSNSVDNSILYSKEWKFGTPLSTILNDFNNIPSIDNSHLGLLEVYDFKGYSLVKGSNTLINDQFAVNGETELWTVFKLENNVRKIVHPEWFNVESWTYNEDVDIEFYGTTGVALSPKYEILKGKITIPAEIEFNGKMEPVIALKDFGGTIDSNSNHEFTHVFMEEGKENKLYLISSEAFIKSKNLVYFDFDRCAVRVIGQKAFQGCSKLTNTTFGNQLFYVHAWAFNQALTSNQPTTVFIPSSLVAIKELGFGVLGYAEGSTLEIGNENNLSVLQFSENDLDPFYQNPGNLFKIVNFYSHYYDAGNELAITKLNQACMNNAIISIV